MKCVNKYTNPGEWGNYSIQSNINGAVFFHITTIGVMSLSSSSLSSMLEFVYFCMWGRRSKKKIGKIDRIQFYVNFCFWATREKTNIAYAHNALTRISFVWFIECDSVWFGGQVCALYALLIFNFTLNSIFDVVLVVNWSEPLKCENRWLSAYIYKQTRL